MASAAVAILATVRSQKRVAAPRAQKPGNDNTPPVCKGDRPIGTFPNCCPIGTFFKDGACRRRDTGNGTKPDEGGGTQGTKKCPAGTHFERTLKHPLGACVSDTGNGGTQGTKPGEDKVHARNNWLPAAEPDTVHRRARWNAAKLLLSAGPHSTRSEQCETDAKPTPKPKPTPTGPSPKKQCSGGKVPRSGDGACLSEWDDGSRRKMRGRGEMIASRYVNRRDPKTRFRDGSVSVRLALLGLMALAVAAPAAAGCDDDERLPAPHSLRRTPSARAASCCSGRATPDTTTSKSGRGRPAGAGERLTSSGARPTRTTTSSTVSIPTKSTSSPSAPAPRRHAGMHFQEPLRDGPRQDGFSPTWNQSCRYYAQTAMEDIQKMRKQQCEIPGDRFSGIWESARARSSSTASSRGGLDCTETPMPSGCAIRTFGRAKGTRTSAWCMSTTL